MDFPCGLMCMWVNVLYLFFLAVTHQIDTTMVYPIVYHSSVVRLLKAVQFIPVHDLHKRADFAQNDAP